MDQAIVKAAENILARGRGILRKKAPYLATTIYGLVPQATDQIQTIAVTKGLVLLFNPYWVVGDPELSDPKTGGDVVCGCLYHECWHVVQGLDRIEALRDKGVALCLPLEDAAYLANIAADLAINGMLQKAGILLPKWVQYPSKYGFDEGLTMEKYWELLQKKQKQVLKELHTDQAAPQEGEGDSTGKKQKGEAKGPRVCSGNCGGIAGGEQKQEEEAVDEKLGRHQVDIERIRRSTAEDIKGHIKSHGRGSTPGFYEEDLDFLRERSKNDWNKELRHVLVRATGAVQAGDEDYDMARPDRRSALLGVVLPGLSDQEIEVAFIRDTSASMGNEQLNVANNEAISIMQSLGIDRAWFLDADTAVKGVPKMMSLRDIPAAKVKGRGGTSFVQPLEVVSKLRPKPDIVVYLTDGDGDAPDKPPRGIRVVWCIVPTRYGHRPAPWGHLVICDNDQAVRDTILNSV